MKWFTVRDEEKLDGSVISFADDSFAKVLCNHGEAVFRALHLLEEEILVFRVLLQTSLHFHHGSVLGSALGAFVLVVTEAPLMERVQAHEMDCGDVQCESASRALA